MNLSKATNQELYQIAMNESNRMGERYEAARELQRRKGEGNGREMQLSKMQPERGHNLGLSWTMYGSQKFNS